MNPNKLHFIGCTFCLLFGQHSTFFRALKEFSFSSLTNVGEEKNPIFSLPKIEKHFNQKEGGDSSLTG